MDETPLLPPPPRGYPILPGTWLGYPRWQVVGMALLAIGGVGAGIAWSVYWSDTPDHWLGLIIFFALGIGFPLVWIRSRVQWIFLLRHGEEIHATILRERLEGRRLVIDIEYAFRGKTYPGAVAGTDRRQPRITTSKKLAILVDPDSPERFLPLPSDYP